MQPTLPAIWKRCLPLVLRLLAFHSLAATETQLAYSVCLF